VFHAFSFHWCKKTRVLVRFVINLASMRLSCLDVVMGVSASTCFPFSLAQQQVHSVPFACSCAAGWFGVNTPLSPLWRDNSAVSPLDAVKVHFALPTA
jgi:hypothetical protein